MRVIYTFLIVICPIFCSFADEPTNAYDAEIINTISKIKQISPNGKFGNDSNIFSKRVVISDSEMTVQYSNIDIFSPTKSFLVTRLINGQLIDERFCLPKGQISKKTPIPTLSREQAIAKATPFFKLLLANDSHCLLDSPKADFSLQYHIIEGYFPGYWHVRWKRVDRKGHHFPDDEVNVGVTEDGQLVFYDQDLSSLFEESDAAVIDSVKILPKALETAQEMVGISMFRMECQPGTGKLDPKPECKLQIVNPNDLPHGKLPYTHNPVARLAWVSWFSWVPNEGSKHLVVAVWIDAYTGEVIGGDGVM